MRRGFTLIELMVGIAILTILTALAGGTLWQQRKVAIAESQRERAWQALDYAADRVARGEPLEGPAVTALLEKLPSGKLATRDGALTVDWVDATGRAETLRLAVFSRAHR
jgi:prepilin-type N-terminal cleavage/methylation domain-containing protein